MSDLRDKVAKIYRERSVMDLTKSDEIIQLVKETVMEKVDSMKYSALKNSRNKLLDKVNSKIDEV